MSEDKTAIELHLTHFNQSGLLKMVFLLHCSGELHPGPVQQQFTSSLPAVKWYIKIRNAWAECCTSEIKKNVYVSILYFGSFKPEVYLPLEKNVSVYKVFQKF